MVSPSFLTESIKSIISFAVAGSAQRTIFSSLIFKASARLLLLNNGALILPTALTCANTSIPVCFNSNFAIAPAATLAAVSRAEERPPPR
ncbi:hypothetical protein D9M68_749060 [compost metagenome]